MARFAGEIAPVRDLHVGQRHPAVDVSFRILRNPVGGLFGFIIVVIAVMAIAAPLVTPNNDPFDTTLNTFAGPSLDHPFGTDNLGRDQYARIVYGARPALKVGFFSVLLAVGVGSLVGLVSGFLGGTFDLLIQRIVDGILALPTLVLVLAIVSVLGPSLLNALLAIGVVFAAAVSRIIRGSVIGVKQNIYIEAARAIGASNTRLIFRHVLPNVTAPILVLISTLLGAAVLLDASLSFLGLGTPPPSPSWGLMLATSGRTYAETAPWLAIVPGLAVSITVLSFNMVGDVIRDQLDPRLRGSRGRA